MDIRRIGQPTPTVDGVRRETVVVAGQNDHWQRRIGQHPRGTIDELEGHTIVVEDITSEQKYPGSRLLCRADYLSKGVQIITAVVEAEVQVGAVNQDEVVRGNQSAVLASQSDCLCSV